MLPAPSHCTIGTIFRVGLLFLAPAAYAGAGDGARATPTDVADAAPIRIMDTVVVSGVQPGPGLWHLERDGHELWVLGTLSPLPKHMHWDSSRVERLIARSQALIAPGSAVISADVGFFSRLALLPTAMRARNNPDGKKLAEVVPADLYARWQALKMRYLPRDRSIERRRPALAAQRLYAKALAANALSSKPVIWPILRKAGKRAKVDLIEPSVRLEIANPKAVLQSFANQTLDDTACFRATLERLELDIDAMKQRANAWATGDIDALARLPHVDNEGECQDAWLRSEIAKEQGFDDLDARVRRAWLDAVDQTSRTRPSVVAVASIAQLTGDAGRLAALSERGFTVTPPKQALPAPVVDADAAAFSDSPGR